MSDAVKALVKSDSDIQGIRQQGMRDGMRTLRLSGAQKVGAGITTIAEVLRVAPASQD
jgi:general secretion pathway protein E